MTHCDIYNINFYWCVDMLQRACVDAMRQGTRVCAESESKDPGCQNVPGQIKWKCALKVCAKVMRRTHFKNTFSPAAVLVLFLFLFLFADLGAPEGLQGQPAGASEDNLRNARRRIKCTANSP